MQALLAEQAWDREAALRTVHRFVLAYLSDPGAVLILDETAELEKADDGGGPTSAP